MNDAIFRLVTRSDFDGLVCAALLKEINIVDEVKFVHPKDMQDGKIEITQKDIVANLPYVKSAYLTFDHHASELDRNRKEQPSNYINIPSSPSAARVIYNHYGGEPRFKKISPSIMEAVDKSDSANFALEDIMDPRDWILLSFVMDARTGLGRFRDFKISNYQLMMKLVDEMMEKPINEILQLPDVKERTDLYHSQKEKFQDQIRRCSEIYDNLVVLNLLHEDTVYAGNRFMIYALYRDCNVSANMMWGLRKQAVVFAIGKSILNRSCQINIGQLCLSHGGGGHVASGTCQIPVEKSQRVKKQLIEALTKRA